MTDLGPELPHRLSRRALLRSTAAGGAGLLAAYLVGCGDGDGTEPQATATRPAPTLTPAPVEPSPTPSVLGWQRLSPSGELPPPRRDHSLVLAGEQLCLFGGRSADDLDDLWSYDLASASWSEVETNGGPPPRHGHNAVADPRRSRIVIFGGQQDGGTFFNDAWIFEPDTKEWTKRSVAGDVPAPRYGAGGALDAGGSGRLLLTHGFTSSGRFNDTWQHDLAGGSWGDISPPGTKPVERCLMRAVWHQESERLLMFGGQTTGTPFLGDLWGLGPEGWTEITAQPRPSPRTFYAMAFDQAAERLMLFGGNTEDGPANDLWFFDAVSDSWEQASPEGEAPSPRFGHDAVWVAATRSFIVFGGNDGSTDVNDMWELSVPV